MAGRSLARALVDQEIDRQDRMWGATYERADNSNRELMHAGMAQLAALNLRQENDPDAFALPPLGWPENWSKTGFRDYGSDIANLTVAAAYLIQEIARKLRLGEDTTRTPRNHDTHPYLGDQPLTTEV